MCLLRVFAEPGKTDAVVAALEAQDHVRHIVIGGVAADTGKAHVTPERRGAAAPEKEAA